VTDRPAHWPARLVDAHVHAWPRGLRHPAQRAVGALEATPRRLMDVLTSRHVDGAVLVQPSILADPSTTLLAAREHARLVPVVEARLDADDATERLAGAAARGAAGVRIHVLNEGLPEPSRRDRLWDLVGSAARLGLVVEWIARPRDAWAILETAERHPDLVQVLDHLGLPDDPDDMAARQAVIAVAAAPRAFTKLSAMHSFSAQPFPYRDTWSWVEAIVAAFGPDRVTWGSNWPLGTEDVAYEDLIELMWQLPFIAERDIPGLLGGTAERVWPALAAGRVGITEGSWQSDG
jgi:L-fuconolactonase